MHYPTDYKLLWECCDKAYKARKKETEPLYIFFEIHTANAVRLAEKQLEWQQAEAAR